MTFLKKIFSEDSLIGITISIFVLPLLLLIHLGYSRFKKSKTAYYGFKFSFC